MIDVNQLNPGDRVVINSPRQGVAKRAMVEFDGIFATAYEAIAHVMAHSALVGVDTTGDLNGPFANFRFNTGLCAAFRVEPDGSMRDDMGRAVYVEECLGRARMG